MHQREKKHLLSLFVGLALFWGVLSGHSEPLLLFLGFLSVVFALYLAWRMDVVDRESHPLHLSGRLVIYWIWLLREIVTSNWQVIKLLMSPNMPINPSVVVIRSEQSSDLGRVILANSITLTPGTVSLDVKDDQIEVHTLAPQFVEGILDGSFDRRIPMDVASRKELP